MTENETRDDRATISPSLPAGAISFDMACVQCGYNLRGLTRRSRCPECNTPIADSFHDNLLQFANHHWVGRLALGSLLLAGVIAVEVFIIFFNAVFEWPPWVFVTLELGLSTVALAGLLLMSSREPHTIAAPYRLVWDLRISGIATFALAAATGFNLLFEWTDFPLPSAVFTAAAADTVLLGIRFRYLAERIPDETLAAQSLNLTWGMAALLAMLVSLEFGLCCMFIVPIGILTPICVSWAIVLLCSFVYDFRYCARSPASCGHNSNCRRGKK